jgi:hypothetical protein
MGNTILVRQKETALQRAKRLSLETGKAYVVYLEDGEDGFYPAECIMLAYEFFNYYEGVETGRPYAYNRNALYYVENGEINEAETEIINDII